MLYVHSGKGRVRLAMEAQQRWQPVKKSPPTFPIDNARARPHRPAVHLQLETGMAPNRAQDRDHYHLWSMSHRKRAGRVGGIWYPLVRGFHTRQAAGQWGKRNRPDRERMILKCEEACCAPKLD